MTAKKVLYFKDIEIGREFKPLIYKLTEETILKNVQPEMIFQRDRRAREA